MNEKSETEYSKIETFKAPPQPVYCCVDDEGNNFIYSGADTFVNLPDGEEKERWMRKISENKVSIAEIAGCEIYDPATGETELRISDDWSLST